MSKVIPHQILESGGLKEKHSQNLNIMKIILKESQLKNIVNLLMEQKLPDANAYQIQQFLIDKGFLPKTHPETGKPTKDGDFHDYSAAAFARYYYGVNTDINSVDGLWNELKKKKFKVGSTTGFGPMMATVISGIIKDKEGKKQNRNIAQHSVGGGDIGDSYWKLKKGTREKIDNWVSTIKKSQKNMKLYIETINKFNCLGNFELQVAVFVIWELKEKIKRSMGIPDDKTLLKLIKYSIGITGRETDVGEGGTWSDATSEIFRSTGLGSLVSLFGGDTQSLGHGQFMKDTWYSYGIDKIVGEYNKSFDWTSQILALIYRLKTDLDIAEKRGVGTSPSVNPIIKKREDAKRKKQGKKKMFSIDGSGNIALDLAILAHNMGKGKIKKYCRTSNPNYAGPCDRKKYTPKKSVGEVTVYQDEWIPGYFPNLEGGSHTAIGYIEEVQRWVDAKTNCLDLAVGYAEKVPAMLTPDEIKILKDKELQHLQKKYKITPKQIEDIKNTPPPGGYTI